MDATKVFDTGYSVLPDTVEADHAARAARRMEKICATPAEQALFKFAPLEARYNDHPGQPLDDYATLNPRGD